MVGLIALIAVLHIIGIYFYLEWRLLWYYPFVHALSGFWVTYVAFTLLGSRVWLFGSAGRIFLAGFIFSLTAGLLWEVFELQSGITLLNDSGYWSNSMRDVISGVIGGVASALFVLITSKKIQLINNKYE